MAHQSGPQSEAYHKEQAARARELFVASLTPEASAGDRETAMREATAIVTQCLSATSDLTNVAKGVAASGAHLAVLRQMLAPPVSQDRFKLMCPAYPKDAEKEGKPVSPDAAAKVAAVFEVWRDRRLTAWLDENRSPTRAEVEMIVASLSSLLASQRVTTVQRNRLCDVQERAVVDLLESKSWTRLPSRRVVSLEVLPAKTFMRKTKFATKQRDQEVDIACGLGKLVGCAMECKVTNDETNSIKRINDVLKKAKAWQDHWGSFIRTAALLQGVVKPHDVHRLLAADVRVFWSHDLTQFAKWLDSPT